MNAVISSVCAGFFSLSVAGQSHVIPYGTDFLTAGLGNPVFCKPVSVFMAPGLLGDSLENGISIATDRFAGLPVTRKVEAVSSFSMKGHSGLGVRLAMLGKDVFRLNQFGLAYGKLLRKGSDGQSRWLMGLVFQAQQEKTGWVKSPLQWVSGLSVVRSNQHSSYSILLLRSSYKKSGWQWSVNARRFWSRQLVSELSVTYLNNSIQLPAFSIQYHISDKAYILGQWQQLPSAIYWEQGYRLSTFWLSVFVRRYPGIGWKSGLGLVWHSAKRNGRHE